jgi:uncharacterized protein (DUF3820 family)
LQKLYAGTLYKIMAKYQYKGCRPQMPFGKYRGRPIDCVPTDYLYWLALNGEFRKDEWLEEVIAELDERRRLAEQNSDAQNKSFRRRS